MERGIFFIEDYFVFDKQANVPINLNLKGVIGAELNRLLPAGRGVWKSGRIDITSLHYTSPV